jgi:hypothetical protein
MAARESYQAPSGTTDGQHECSRGQWCSSSTRDADGFWYPARTYQAFCPADQAKIVTDLETLPSAFIKLAARIGDPGRSGRSVRMPPGSRVLISPDIDALMRDMVTALGAWAARVRVVPGLDLSPHGHPHGTAAAVQADCDVLAKHPEPLLALPPGPMLRTETFPAARPGARRAAPVPCRRCSVPLFPSPSGRRWWPAVCTHRLAAPVIAYDKFDRPVISRWQCQACGARMPVDPELRPACRHVPAGAVFLPPGGMPTDAEAEIGDLEVIHAGISEGWVTVIKDLGGAVAGLDIIGFARRATVLLGENPAPPDLLEGVPCKACEAMSSLAMLEQPPPDPEKPAPLFCKCTGCHAVMTRKEYDAWVDMYAAWKHGRTVCRRCELGMCPECCWDGCTCATSEHPRRHAAA